MTIPSAPPTQPTAETPRSRLVLLVGTACVLAGSVLPGWRGGWPGALLGLGFVLQGVVLLRASGAARRAAGEPPPRPGAGLGRAVGAVVVLLGLALLARAGWDLLPR